MVLYSTVGQQHRIAHVQGLLLALPIQSNSAGDHDEHTQMRRPSHNLMEWCSHILHYSSGELMARMSVHRINVKDLNEFNDRVMPNSCLCL